MHCAARHSHSATVSRNVSSTTPRPPFGPRSGCETIMPDPVTYRVVHTTRCVYSNAVTNARQLAHLKPRTAPWQTGRAHHIEVDPAPSEQFEGVDYFGNSVMHFAVETPHGELTVRAESIVEVQSHAPETDIDAGPAWESALAAPGVGDRDSELDVVQFRLASPMVPV